MPVQMGFICIICRESFTTQCSTKPFNSSSGRQDQKTCNPILKSKESVVDFIVATKCGHIFHYKCLSTWLSKCYENLKCVACNQLIYTYELVQLFPAEDDGSDERDGYDEEPYTDLRSSTQNIRDMLSLVEYLLKDLEQRDQITSQRIGSLKSHVVGGEEREIPSPNINIIRPNGTTIVPSSPNTSNGPNHLKSLTKEEEARSVQRVVEIIQRQRDEAEDLKTTHYKELHQELLNIHAEYTQLFRRVGKSSSGLLCSPAITISTTNANSVDEGCKKILPRNSSEDENDGSEMLSFHKAAQERCKGFLSTLISETNGEDIIIGNGLNIPHRASSLIGPDLALGGMMDNAILSDKAREFTWDEPRPKNGFSKKLLLPGDKVAWNVRGQVELGTVKWKGFVGSIIHAGVEFDNLIGLPIEKEDLDCLFKSKPGHGYLVPVEELIKPEYLISLQTSKFQNETSRKETIISSILNKMRQLRTIRS